MENQKHMAIDEAALARHASPAAKPLFVRERRKSLAWINLRELWGYHELLYFLAWRDVKVRYKQTLLGVAWAVIQPLSTMIIFTLFFGRFINIKTAGVPYPLFAYAGVMLWTFFSNTTINSSNSLVANSGLITKVYFPRILIPAAAVGAGLVDLFFSFLVLLGLVAWYGVHLQLTWGVLLIPLLILLLFLLALAVGFLMSALNIKYRDVRHAFPFLAQLSLFVSPVIFPSDAFEGKWRAALMLNPLTGIIENFRAAVYGREFNWPALAVSATVTLALLVYSSYKFQKTEQSFADII
jgi:lipopolysaccharide transport system permease protein